MLVQILLESEENWKSKKLIEKAACGGQVEMKRCGGIEVYWGNPSDCSAKKRDARKYFVERVPDFCSIQRKILARLIENRNLFVRIKVVGCIH